MKLYVIIIAAVFYLPIMFVYSQEATPSPTPAPPKEEREELVTIVESYHKRHQTWSIITFIGYAGLFFISGVANVIAAIVVKSDKIKDPRWSNVAFWGALLGAAAVTFNGTYGLGDRWASNRQSQGLIEELEIDMNDRNMSNQAIRTKLKEIEVAHSKEKLTQKIK